jgi:hypothetical protein
MMTIHASLKMFLLMELMHVHLQQMVYNKCLQFTHVRREVLKEVHMKMAVFCDFTM